MENQEQLKVNTTSYGVRLPSDVKDKLTKVISESGLQASEFFNQVVDLYQSQSENTVVRSEVTDIAKYLKLIGQRVESLASVADVAEQEKNNLSSIHFEQLGQSFDELKIVNQEVDSLKLVVSEKDKKINELEDFHTSRVIELQAEIKRLRGLESIIDDVRQSSLQAQKELSLMKTKHDELIAENTNMKSIIQTLTISNEKLETKLEMTTQQLEEKKTELLNIRKPQGKPLTIQSTKEFIPPVDMSETDTKIMTLKSQGVIHREIADILNSENLFTATGKHWNEDNIKKRISTIKKNEE